MVIGLGDGDQAPGVVHRHPNEDQAQADGGPGRYGERQDRREEEARPADHRSEPSELTDRRRVQARALGGVESKERKRPHSPTSALPPQGGPSLPALRSIVKARLAQSPIKVVTTPVAQSATATRWLFVSAM